MFEKPQNTVGARHAGRNQRGIALIIVISFVMMMTVAVLDILEGSGLSTQMAMNAQRQMQAFYLARSSVNLSKLAIHLVTKYKSQLTALGMDPKTILRQFPLDSSMLRAGLTSPSEAAAPAEEAADSGSETAAGEDGSLLSTDSMLNTGNFLDREKTEEFLSFAGDFTAELSEEQAKYSLNAISKIDPANANFDLYKRILLQILMGDAFQTYFENRDRDAETLVHALSDYIDANDIVNEFDKVERGSESSLYTNADFPVKNAKYLTLSEIRLVPGMSDDIYLALEPLVTVYHTDTTINPCTADVGTVDALIAHYTRYGECTTPLDLEDDKEFIAELRDEMLLSCPSTSSMASTLNVRLGLKDASEVASATTSGTADTRQTSSQVTQCKVQFEQLISDKSTIYTVKARGTIENVERTITVVLDTSSGSPSSWKTLYYKVQ